MQTQPDADLRKAYKMTVIFGGFMVASVFVYAVLIELIKKKHAPFAGFSPMPEDMMMILRYVLLGVAAVEFFAIRLIRRAMLSAKAPIGGAQNNAKFGPEGQMLMTAEIVTYALCESAVICGIALFLIQGNSMDFYLFMFISLIYFGIFFPRYSKWEEWMRERRNPMREQGREE